MNINLTICSSIIIVITIFIVFIMFIVMHDCDDHHDLLVKFSLFSVIIIAIIMED